MPSVVLAQHRGPCAHKAARTQLYVVANRSQAIRDLIVRYNDLLLAQIQQSVACNALHAVEERLCRWLLQADDCAEGHTVPLTQEFLGQMLGVRRTTVTVAARLLQARGLIRYRPGHIEITGSRRAGTHVLRMLCGSPAQRR
jgi:CRP-like cAMP-binding protein